MSPGEFRLPCLTSCVNDFWLNFVHLPKDVPHCGDGDQDGDRQHNVGDQFARAG